MQNNTVKILLLIQKKKTIEISIEQSSFKIAQELEKIEQTFSGYCSNIANPLPKPVRGALLPPNSGLLFGDHDHLRLRASKFLSTVNQLAEGPSISYDQQLLNQQQLIQLNTDLKNLKDSVKKLQDEKILLENDKLKLSNELTQCKDAFSEKKAQFAQVLADLADTREKLNSISNQRQDTPTYTTTPAPPSNQRSKDQANTSKWTLTVMDETGNQSNSLNVPVQDQERESKLRLYYQEKFTAFESQLQQADTKILDLFSRKESLEQLLQQTKDERDILLEQLRTTKATLAQSSELVETTRLNYEQNVRELTDHCVSLQEKISHYNDELQTIKNFKVRCGKCKNWNTIEWLMTEGQNGQLCAKGNHYSSLNYA